MYDLSPEPEPPHTYECLLCGERTTAERQPVACASCGGTMLNIDNPRE